MSECWEKYLEDTRRVCKYGLKCYQKNENHHAEFKHPPKNARPRLKSPNSKRIKVMSPTNSNTDKANSSNEEQKFNLHTETGASTDKSFIAKASDTADAITMGSITEIANGSMKLHNIPENVEDFIESLFFVKMAKDFYSFWEFSKTLNSVPQDAFKEIGLHLVGPYDVVAGTLPISQDENTYLLNWRYYFDPPEFQTVLATKDKDGFHMGYYRDSPDDIPCFIASGSLSSCKITPVAENIFGALNVYLERTKKKSPFKSILCHKIQAKLKLWARENDFTLDILTPKMKIRQVKVVSKTFHEAGIVVSVEKKTELGYRPLVESEAKIKNKLESLASATTDSQKEKAMSSLQELITMANIATDECDFGTGLELGLDFFSFGHPALHVSAENLLKTAYSMLNRDHFGKIITVHLANRRKGIDMSLHNL